MITDEWVAFKSKLIESECGRAGAIEFLEFALLVLRQEKRFWDAREASERESVLPS